MMTVSLIRFSLALAGAGLLVLAPGTVRAHGDVHADIEALTKQIEKEPGQAPLHLKRGELHRIHGDWDAALADFDTVGVLDPKMPLLDFLRGRALAEAKWCRSAKVFLDRFLSRQPDHVEGLVVRARVLVQLGQRLAGVQDYTRAVARTTEPRPELFIERAEALTAEGAAHYQEALQGLDEGLKKLGQLVTLQLAAIDLEVKQKRTDAALARLEKAAAQSPRKETWLTRRGDILKEGGRPEEARQAYRAALAALDTLPPARRNVPAMEELAKRLRSSLESLMPQAGIVPGVVPWP
jgi:predicted Zn-dependent protease